MLSPEHFAPPRGHASVTHCISEHTLTQQGAEEVALEDVDDSVQRLLQLVVFMFGLVLVLALASLVKFGPVLPQKLQGSASV